MKYSSFYQQHCEEAKIKREKRNVMGVFWGLIVWLVVMDFIIMIGAVVKHSN